MEEKVFYCLIVGSRTFNDYAILKEKMDKILSNKKSMHIVIVSGGAAGADTLAYRYGKENGYENIVMNADWKKYGKSAGYIRNEEMHKFIAQYSDRGVVAFWDGKSKGTAHSFDLAKKYNNPIRVVRF